MHPELVQLLDVDLRAERHAAAARRRVATSCPQVADRPVAPGRGQPVDALRRRVGFGLVAAGLRLALPRA